MTKKRKQSKGERRSYLDGFISGFAHGKGIEDWPLILRDDDAPAYVWFKEGQKEFHAIGDRKVIQRFIDLYENFESQTLPHWK